MTKKAISAVLTFQMKEAIDSTFLTFSVGLPHGEETIFLLEANKNIPSFSRSIFNMDVGDQGETTFSSYEEVLVKEGQLPLIMQTIQEHIGELEELRDMMEVKWGPGLQCAYRNTKKWETRLATHMMVIKKAKECPQEFIYSLPLIFVNKC